MLLAGLIALPQLGMSQDKERKQETDREKQARLTLEIDGVECPGCVQAMTSTLAETELKTVDPIKANTVGPTRVIATCPADCDLGSAAAKVIKAQTPHREKVPPTLTLVLFASLDAKSAPTALATCQKIEGIDGSACEADSKTGEIHLRINGKKKVTFGQVVAAFQDAGIQVRTAGSAATTRSTTSR
jgi:hypothetical protein